MINHYRIAIFFFLMFSSVLLFEGRPDRGWSSSDMSPRLKRESHSLAFAWFKASSLKAFRSIVTVSAAVFPKKETKLDTKTLFF